MSSSVFEIHVRVLVLLGSGEICSWRSGLLFGLVFVSWCGLILALIPFSCSGFFLCGEEGKMLPVFNLVVPTCQYGMADEWEETWRARAVISISRQGVTVDTMYATLTSSMIHLNLSLMLSTAKLPKSSLKGGKLQ